MLVVFLMSVISVHRDFCSFVVSLIFQTHDTHQERKGDTVAQIEADFKEDESEREQWEAATCLV